MTDEPGFRAGYVAIIGEPNAGKSTLLNTLVGTKVSIVTDKPQTTRHKIVGIMTNEQAQIVFLDTPGILRPRYLLHEVMMDAVAAALSDADVICFMVDAARTAAKGPAHHDASVDLFSKVSKPVYLLLNKVDIVAKDNLLPMIAVASAKFPYREIFPISALRHIGTDDLLKALIAEMPVHPAFYPSDIVSEHSERFIAGELVRESIFRHVEEELPYSTTVEITEFKEQEGEKDLIRAEIIVERDSQKGIVIGKGGKTLGLIGKDARLAIEEFLQRPVFLELYVRVRLKWRESDTWLQRLGYR